MDFPLPWTLTAAAALFVALLIAEQLWRDRAGNWRRWPLNLTLGALMFGVGRLLAFAGPLAAALWAQQTGFGLLNLLAPPFWLAALLSVIAMDLAVWLQHRQFHIWSWMWRWHRLHHSDEALDLSTAVRFHPMEGIISTLWKSAATALIGVPPLAVPLFELWLMAGSLIEHSNVRLPRALDAALRLLFVTPAMHRVHHSAHGDDAQHNYGFAIALWDRWFGCYRAAPSGERIGVGEVP